MIILRQRALPMGTRSKLWSVVGEGANQTMGEEWIVWPNRDRYGNADRVFRYDRGA